MRLASFPTKTKNTFFEEKYFFIIGLSEVKISQISQPMTALCSLCQPGLFPTHLDLLFKENVVLLFLKGLKGILNIKLMISRELI